MTLFIKKLIPAKNTVTIGVELGHEYIRMVKVKGSENPVLLDHKVVTLPQSMDIRTPEFADILKSELSQFCESLKEAAIWTAMSAYSVDIRHIRIPKVGKKQIANAVYWTVKKEAPFDERDTVLDFAVQGEIIENDNPKLSVMAYTAPAREVDELKALFSGIGLPLKGISVAPFALQNIFRKNRHEMEGTIAVLSIGDDSSRLDIFAQGSLVFTRNINTEINSTVEPGIHALERLARQIEMTFEHYAINLGNEKIDRLYVSGDMQVQEKVLEHMREQMRFPSEALEPMSFISSGEMKFPEKFTALGLALSGSDTPNLLHVYKDKEKESSITRINGYIFAVFMVIVMICTAIFIYQGRIEAGKKKVLAGLEQELSGYNPQLDQNMIMQTAAKIKDRDGNLKEYGRRYLMIAVIEELSVLTPVEIQLIKMAAKADGLTMEGVAAGDRYSAEATLSGFIMKLDSSPIFSQISVQKGEFAAKKGLNFTINLKVGQP